MTGFRRWADGAVPTVSRVPHQAPDPTHLPTGSPGGAAPRAAGFKVFRQFNDPALAVFAAADTRIDNKLAAAFCGDSLEHRIVRELGARRALAVKEVYESFEFFARVRKDLRQRDVVDLCCGHGLVGLLFAAFERAVERVVLCDERRPHNHDLVLAAVRAAAPWVTDKVRYVERPLKRLAGELPAGAGLLAVHACGVRTDRCLELALRGGGPFAAMPCCYEGTAPTVSLPLRELLGVPLAVDARRTQQLEAAGYVVRWTAIPPVITPVNRVLLAVPKPAVGDA